MKFKDFGIYTDDDTLRLLIQTGNPNYVYVVRFPLTQFSELTNDCINTILYFEYSKIEEYQIHILNVNSKYIDALSRDWGYLGIIDNKGSIRSKIYSHIEDIKPQFRVH